MSYFLRYRKVLQYTDTDMDRLEDSFANLKTSPIFRQTDKNQSAGAFWRTIGEVAEYQLISRLAMTICLIPHSHAVAERIFSMIGKNLTASRKCLEEGNHADQPHDHQVRWF